MAINRWSWCRLMAFCRVPFFVNSITTTSDGKLEKLFISPAGGDRDLKVSEGEFSNGLGKDYTKLHLSWWWRTKAGVWGGSWLNFSGDRKAKSFPGTGTCKTFQLYVEDICDRTCCCDRRNVHFYNDPFLSPLSFKGHFIGFPIRRV